MVTRKAPSRCSEVTSCGSAPAACGSRTCRNSVFAVWLAGVTSTRQAPGSVVELGFGMLG